MQEVEQRKEQLPRHEGHEEKQLIQYIENFVLFVPSW